MRQRRRGTRDTGPKRGRGVYFFLLALVLAWCVLVWLVGVRDGSVLQSALTDRQPCNHNNVAHVCGRDSNNHHNVFSPSPRRRGPWTPWPSAYVGAETDGESECDGHISRTGRSIHTGQGHTFGLVVLGAVLFFLGLEACCVHEHAHHACEDGAVSWPFVASHRAATHTGNERERDC